MFVGYPCAGYSKIYATAVQLQADQGALPRCRGLCLQPTVMPLCACRLCRYALAGHAAMRLPVMPLCACRSCRCAPAGHDPSLMLAELARPVVDNRQPSRGVWSVAKGDGGWAPASSPPSASHFSTLCENSVTRLHDNNVRIPLGDLFVGLDMNGGVFATLMISFHP
jgi:hypothetical protein